MACRVRISRKLSFCIIDSIGDEDDNGGKTMQVAEVNALRMHYAESGDPAGLPLVFANSLGTDLRVGSSVLPLLPPGLRILRYDMRGHGLTDAPADDYFMGDLVADAAAL